MKSLSWKLGRVAGIDVYLHPTFFLAPLYAVAIAPEGMGGLALIMTLALFGCVLLHELGHALAARCYDIATADITLYPIGGVARLARMPRKAGPELLIALAGPAVNLAIALGLGALLLLGAGLAPSWVEQSWAGSFLIMLLVLNLLLAGFNLMPAFPMDGGRVLRAVLSGWIGRLRATEIAASLGRILAVLFGFWSLVSQQNLIHLLLAAFIYIAAGMELRRVRFEERQAALGRGPDTAPNGYRWVHVGPGIWRLAPVMVLTPEELRSARSPWV